MGGLILGVQMNERKMFILVHGHIKGLHAVHNITLVPVLCCVCCEGDAGIELISIPHCECSVSSIQLSKFWISRTAF